MAPWWRGSRIWRHLAKLWNHRLHPKLRIVCRLPIIICSCFGGDGKFGSCDTCSFCVTSHTFNHNGACGERTAQDNGPAYQICRATLHEECPQRHGHKGDPGVIPGTCGAVGERAQVILVWVRAPTLETPPTYGD